MVFMLCIVKHLDAEAYMTYAPRVKHLRHFDQVTGTSTFTNLVGYPPESMIVASSLSWYAGTFDISLYVS